MKSNLKFFKDAKSLSVDQFLEKVLYKKDKGYYNSKFPFGYKGDFVTAPNISNLFSEMIAVWMISTWEIIGKPKKFNIIELGPGDGSLVEVLLKVFKKFKQFNSSKKIYLFEKSEYLKKIQKKNINNNEVTWIDNFNKIKSGPVIFFGNEFFDAIPIKQFKRDKKYLFEKYFVLQKCNKIKEIYRKTSNKNTKIINSYKTFDKIKFIEFPKIGLNYLDEIAKKISNLGGCILMIDYGYLKPNNQNTLQSVIKHKKNYIFDNLGKADISSLVNFPLIKEFFLKKDLQVKGVISQKEFLKNMGIEERAEIISKNMKFREKSNLYLRLKRLISPKLMGDLFKVILAYNFKSDKYFGFK